MKKKDTIKSKFEFTDIINNGKFIKNIIQYNGLRRGGGAIMKRTYQPNNRKMKKKHGFFARKESNILNSRRKKGRKRLCK